MTRSKGLFVNVKFFECFKYCEVTQELHNKYSIVFTLYIIEIL